MLLLLPLDTPLSDPLSDTAVGEMLAVLLPLMLLLLLLLGVRWDSGTTGGGSVTGSALSYSSSVWEGAEAAAAAAAAAAADVAATAEAAAVASAAAAVATATVAVAVSMAVIKKFADACTLPTSRERASALATKGKPSRVVGISTSSSSFSIR